MKRTNEKIVSSFFFYMWNGWGTQEECRQVFGDLGDHFWEKWNSLFQRYHGGAAERFYAELSDNNRRLLVDRACAMYDGNCKRSSAPINPHCQKVTGTLNMLTEILNEWWSLQDYETRQTITGRNDCGFDSLDDHDRVMNNHWYELPVEQKITLWRQFTTNKEANPDPELIKKIHIHLNNLRQIDQHNELSMIFWDEQCRGEINIEPWISEWHACEYDFATWYAKLPDAMQRRVIEYYYTHLKD
jgi:hypothetical protein